jgi:hypothetical protein
MTYAGRWQRVGSLDKMEQSIHQIQEERLDGA